MVEKKRDNLKFSVVLWVVCHDAGEVTARIKLKAYRVTQLTGIYKNMSGIAISALEIDNSGNFSDCDVGLCAFIKANEKDFLTLQNLETVQKVYFDVGHFLDDIQVRASCSLSRELISQFAKYSIELELSTYLPIRAD